MKKVEPTGTGRGNRTIIGHIQKRYDSKQIEYQRREVVRTYLSKYMATLLGAEDDTNERSSRDAKGNYTPKNAQLYTSSIMTEAYETIRSSKLFPDTVRFEPTQRVTNQKLVDQAHNIGSLVDYSNEKGDYDTMIREASRDLVFGECYITQEYQKNIEGAPTKLGKKHIKWENVRGFYGDTDIITLERLTVGQFVKEYGAKMLSKVAYGDPISADSELETPTLDDISIMDRDQTIGALKYWDHSLKRHYVLLGGNAYQPPNMQQEGDNYFWVDTDGTGFCPIKRRAYRKPFRGYHGYGVLDLLYPLAYLETVIVNSTAHASVLASDPMLIFYAEDIADMKNKWNQYLASKTAGQQSSPFFAKQDRSNPIAHDQIAFTPDINIFSVWREFVLDEATKRAKIDFRSLTDFAPTADQQRLRKQETDKTNQIVLGENADVDRDFALETVYILKNGESLFHDKEIYLKVGDYFYEDLDAEQKAEMKDETGRYQKVPVPIRDFLETVEDIEFSITPVLDGAFDDQTFFEMQDARNDLALIDPSLPASAKLREFYFTKKYGRVPFEREDFELAAPEAPIPQA